MNGRELREALHQGGRIHSTLITASASAWPEVVRQIGLDIAFIDTEHIALDRSEVARMCRVYDAIGLAPMVCITRPDPFEASMALDGGARAQVGRGSACLLSGCHRATGALARAGRESNRLLGGHHRLPPCHPAAVGRAAGMPWQAAAGTTHGGHQHLSRTGGCGGCPVAHPCRRQV